MLEMEKEGEKHALGVVTRGSFNSNHVRWVLNTTNHFNDEYRSPQTQKLWFSIQNFKHAVLTLHD